ncbi:enoyl-CoA hydratase-related protein [uncultured Hydrogenophaga sp.]|uniref:enoyl-CoA hydratase-related protein n=1 Tax=uncultured Hydrogenophaga sp. TaxID=199683 RepID=UPI00258552CD|nr:enoyl-CoA hydratase-related protein [uncultured Hydrogenophaga sp.]
MKQTLVTTHRTVRLESEDGLARLTLDQPERLNGLSARLHADLREVLDALERDATLRCVLLTGAGRGFCSGADLGSREDNGHDVGPDGRRDLGAMLERDFNPLVLRLRALPVPVVVAVNGVAAGAGVSLALAGDVVLAARGASFVLAFARIGVMPDAGATWLLPRLIGPARAMALCLLGEAMGAEAAQQAGLIWRCTDDGALMAEAEAVCARLARGPALALRHIKTALHAADENTLLEQLALETRLQRELGRSEDCIEGVAAFHEKRPPRFIGR